MSGAPLELMTMHYAAILEVWISRSEWFRATDFRVGAKCEQLASYQSGMKRIQNRTFVLWEEWQGRRLPALLPFQLSLRPPNIRGGYGEGEGMYPPTIFSISVLRASVRLSLKSRNHLWRPSDLVQPRTQLQFVYMHSEGVAAPLEGLASSPL